MRYFDLSLGLGACLLALAADPVKAQGQARCAPRDIMIARLAERYGETRQAIGLGGPDTVMELFAAPATGSWTITVTTANGLTCLMAAGQAFESLSDPLPAKGNDA